MADSPLGAPVEWAPVQPPARAALVGARVTLEPLDAERHSAALFAAGHDGGDPRLWDYMSYGPFADRAAFEEWLGEAEASADPLFFAVTDHRTGEPAGVMSYLRIERAHGVIEIGHIWFAGSLQRTPGATEAVFLLARHAFDDLGYRRLEWKCDALNARSRRAAERLGFTFEGIFRQHQVVKGRNRDTAWFAMTDREWPALRAGFERWLAAGNFDESGAQRASLATLRRRP